MKRRTMVIILLTMIIFAFCTTAALAAYTTLRSGSSGNDVKNMQLALIDLGYQMTADGKYGTTTAARVKQFQKDHGLTADGVAGNKTLTLLYSLANSSSGSSSGSASGNAVATATVKTTGGSLNIRSSASSSAKVIGTIPNGKTIDVYNLGSSWALIKYNGQTGYVSVSYIRVNGSSTATPTPKVTATPTVAPTANTTAGTMATVKTTGGSLNLRSAPTTSSKILTTIKNSTAVNVLSKGSTWTLITVNGYTGYVMNNYLQFSGAQTAAPVPVTAVPVIVTATPAPQTSVTAAYVNTTGGTLNLRTFASTTSAVLTTIPNKTQVSVVEKGTSWSYIQYGVYKGYVMNSYLRFTSETTSPTVQPTATPASSLSGESDAEAAYDTALFTRTLRSGYTGKDVTALQERLAALNYLSSAAISGTYDTATISAVKTFQSVHGLSSDGLAGKNTFTMLFSTTAIAYSDTVSSYSTLHIYYRNKESQNTAAITKMQTALKNLGYTVTVNGSFDETTYLAVLEFQLRNNLSVTGAASSAMQALLYSSYAKPYSATPSVSLSANEGLSDGPSVNDVQLLHWFNEVKLTLSSGDHLIIYDPYTKLSWNIKVYSNGNHCDSEPLTLTDTLVMNKAFGKPSWTIHTVYVQLPDGRWTMATMHNRPHLVGSITNNGFDGHLCIHFLRDLSEVKKNDPNYGLSNQQMLRNSWKALTGITVD